MKKLKFFLTIIITAVMMLLLSRCNKQTYNIANDKSPDVTVNTYSYDIMAHIVIEDTYTFNNEPYYKLYFKTDSDLPIYSCERSGFYLYSSERFDLSKADYDKFFGEGNDTFITTVYKMDAEVPVLKYKKSNALSDLDILEAKGIINGIDSNEDEEIGIVCIHEYRFSVFGESDFSDADKEAAKQEVIASGLESIKEMEELFYKHK